MDIGGVRLDFRGRQGLDIRKGKGLDIGGEKVWTSEGRKG